MIQEYDFSILGVIVAIMGYWMILIALILILAVLERDFIELVLEFSPS
jgi:tellurite resistance protein TehA-like permease